MAVPCRVCAASVKAENMARHVEKVHGGAPAPGPASSWRGRGSVLGWLPARLAVVDGELRARWCLGLRRRTVALAGAAVSVGGLTRARIPAGMSAYATQYNVPTEEVRAGTYLRVGSLTVGCPRSTDVRAHWAGWQQGPKRQAAHLTVDPVAFVGLQYALADAGLLSPRTAA